jgi:threonine dehydratase
VVEPGGAAALAALLARKVDVPADARVGLILSGGNVDRRLFAQVVLG